jgi:hypothetical protein
MNKFVAWIEEQINTGFPLEEQENLKTLHEALQMGVLSDHKGRYVYVKKGLIFHKSFVNAHDVFEINEISNDYNGTLYFIPLDN